MDFNIKFETNSKNSIQKTKQYFIDNKFKLQNEVENKLIFVRGNIFLNMITFNPLQWKSNISIIFEDISVQLNAKISTTGQTVTDHEYNLWETFFNNFKETINQNVNLNIDSKKALKKTKLKSLKLVLKMLGIVISLAVIYGLFNRFILSLF